jgi:hypothetical protein
VQDPDDLDSPGSGHVEDDVAANREAAEVGCQLRSALAHAGLAGQGPKLAVNKRGESIGVLYTVFDDEGPDVREIDERSWLYDYAGRYLRLDVVRVVRRLRPSRFSSETLQGRAGPLCKPS